MLYAILILLYLFENVNFSIFLIKLLKIVKNYEVHIIASRQIT